MAVTVTKVCYFYDGSRLAATDVEEESGLVEGGKWTPSLHMPSYDSTKYYRYTISYNGLNYTTGYLVCPDSDFTVYYYFYGDVTHPGDWDWRSNVSAGVPIRYSKIGENAYEVYPLTASEWNDFIDHITYVAEYAGISLSGSLSSLYVSSGTPMEREVVNAARNVINAMNPSVAVPGEVASNSKIRASFFNGLRDSINSF